MTYYNLNRRNGFLRLFCALLASLLLLGCLSGCQNGGGETDTDGTTLSEENTTSEGERVVVADNGKSDYVIYYERALSSDEGVLALINTLSATVKTNTGAVLSVSPDRYYSEEKADDPAILIGVTKWAESAEIAAQLKTKDYYVGLVGNKVVICGKNAEACTSAIQYFLNKIVTVQGQAGRVLSLSDADTFHKRAEYGIDSILCLGAELSEYRMVLSANADTNASLFAGNLRYWLMQNYGVLLELVTDGEPTVDREIVIGNTARRDIVLLQNEFSVAADGSKLYLAANGLVGYEELYYHVTETMLPATGGACYTLTASAETVNAQERYEDRFGATLENADGARVLFYNVYAWDSCNMELRMQMQLELFRTYSPDVLALQEFSHNARNKGLLSGLGKLGYAEVKVSAGSSNFTPLFYRSDRLEVVDSGYLLYDGLNDVDSKSVTWAVFRRLDTGKRFIVLSTHFYYTNDADGKAARIAEANRLIGLIGTIRSNTAYADLPLLVGGDLNCRASEEPIDVLRAGGLRSVWDAADVKNDCSGHHSYPEYSDVYDTYIRWSKPAGGYAASIDQVWGSGEMTVKRFVTLTNLYALIASDHCPELVDITW